MQPQLGQLQAPAPLLVLELVSPQRSSLVPTLSLLSDGCTNYFVHHGFVCTTFTNRSMQPRISSTIAYCPHHKNNVRDEGLFLKLGHTAVG